MRKNAQEFRDLQKLWYDKAKETGFNDIENGKEGLKQFDSVYFHSRYTPKTFSEKKEYYEWTTHLLKSYPFQNNGSKFIWSLHSQGFSISEIAKRLNIKQWVAHNTIKKIKDESR